MAVICPAFPRLGRTVVGGTVLVDGVPLAHTAAADDPVTPVTESRLDVLLPGAVLADPLDVLAGRPDLDNDQFVCDAATDDDLARIAEVLDRLGRRAVAVGSAGLAQAVAAGWGGGIRRAPDPPPPARRVLVAVSSLHPDALLQLAGLRTFLAGRDDPGVRVISSPAERAVTGRASEIATQLAVEVADQVRTGAYDALVIVGGDGAAAVLDQLQVEAVQIRPHSSRSSRRPGRRRHGGRVTSGHQVRRLRRPGHLDHSCTAAARRPPSRQRSPAPSRSLPIRTEGRLHEHATAPANLGSTSWATSQASDRRSPRKRCYSIPSCARSACRWSSATPTWYESGPMRVGLDPEAVRVISDPRAATNDASTIEVIQTGGSLADVPVGQLSPVAGDGAYRFVEACRLAREGRVDGIVTAPLNKAAMQAGGHKWPGHTELLAHEFGVANFSLVLSAGDLYFFHLTAHVSCNRPSRTARPSGRTRSPTLAGAFVTALGRPDEAIGVAGLNPHAGENRIFGDQDADVLAPLRWLEPGNGIRPTGPLPRMP